MTATRKSDPLLDVIAELGATGKEVNCGMQAFYDEGQRVWVGDELNGHAAEHVFTLDQLDDVIPWLRAAAATVLKRGWHAPDEA